MKRLFALQHFHAVVLKAMPLLFLLLVIAVHEGETAPGDGAYAPPVTPVPSATAAAPAPFGVILADGGLIRTGPLRGEVARPGAVLPALTVGAITALSIIIMFVGVLRFVETQTSPEQRLDAEVIRRQKKTDGKQAKQSTSFILNRLDQVVTGRDFSDDLARELMQADLRMTVSEYILLRAAVVSVAFVAGVLLTRNPATGVILAVAGFFMPRLYIRYRRRKRQEAFNNQLENVLMLLIGALRSGYGFLHALNVVVDEIPPPASDEFRRVVREVGLGLSLSEALQNLVERVDSDDLDMVVTAINIQQEVGGNLATILDVITETIRERVRIQGEIRTLTTQQRVTGYVLAFLPFILGSVLYLLNPVYMSNLFKPGPMLVIPVGATLLVFIGFLLIRKIVDIEV